MSPSVILVVAAAIMFLIAIAERKRPIFWVPLIIAAILTLFASAWQLEREEHAEEKRIADSTATASICEKLKGRIENLEKYVFESSPEVLKENQQEFEICEPYFLANAKDEIDSAAVYLTSGKSELALQLLRNAYLPDIPDSVRDRLWFLKSVAFRELGQEDSADIASDSATAITPYLFWVYNESGNLLVRIKHEEAIAGFDEIIRGGGSYRRDNIRLRSRDPYFLSVRQGKARWLEEFASRGVHEAHNQKGLSLAALNRYEEAIAAFDEAIKHKPDYIGAVYNKACAYSLMRKKSEMLEWLAKAIAVDGKYEQKAQTDSDFEFYHNDPDFRKLVGLD
jgi:tetratricopeptide (TPR) repeat protein